jgi:hypothetical protein
MAIKAANIANRIPEAIAMPQSGSLKIDIRVSSLAAAFSRTPGWTLAAGVAAGFFRRTGACWVAAKREFMIEVLLALGHLE